VGRTVDTYDYQFNYVPAWAIIGGRRRVLPGPPPPPDLAADVLIRDKGSWVFFWPLTDRAVDWIETNVEGGAGADGWFEVGGRYAGPIMEGMEEDGLEVFVE
jgi:hypothetical protein